MSESGKFYGTFIDPILKPMRKRLANFIHPEQKIIDIACGTGAQVFEFSNIAEQVVGIDLSESMIEFAKKSATKRDYSNVEFHIGDATKLFQFQNNEFDVATMSLALHQFDPQLHVNILAEMRRVAKRIIITDYTVPLPKNYIGYGSKIAEFFAGGEHNKHFKMYYALGGLNSILPNNKLTIEHSETFAKGAFQLVVCKSI